MAERISAHLRRWVSLVILASFLALAVGCKALEEGVILPSWVNHPVARQGMTVFVGHGNDDNRFNARLAALADILSQLSDTLGEDVRTSGWREFSTSDKLPEYGLSVVREFEHGSDIWIFAEAESALIEERRTDLQKAKIQQDATIGALMDQVGEAYRSNQDGQAITLLLDAIYDAASKPSSYDVESLVKRAVSYLEAIRLTLSKKKPEVPQVVVTVRRRQLMLDSKVKDAAIRATFDASDVWGNPKTDSLLFGSGEKGRFLFVPYSVAISDEGTIVFSLDIEDRLEKLKGVLDEGLYAQLDEAYQSSKVTFDYHRVSKYSGEAMLLCVVDPGPFDKGQVEASLSTWLTDKGVASSTVSVDGELAETDRQQLAAQYPRADYLLAMTIRQREQTEIGDTPLWVVSGSIQLWDLKTQTLVSESGEMTLVEESLEAAYRDLMQVVTSRFSEYL